MNNQKMINDLAFGELINEAFIKPIRSVTIIDDEYPTIAGLLQNKQYKKVNEDRLKEVIDFCHNTKRNWIVDIDDGQSFIDSFDDSIGSYINSDLLILDYHLEKGDHGSRSLTALNIIRNLAQKTHFNLVVIHTSGYYGNGHDINKIFIDIISYLQSAPIINYGSGTENKVNDFLDEVTVDDEEFEQKLIDSFTDFDFLSVLKDFNGNLSDCSESSHFKEFIRLCDEACDKYNVNRYRKKAMISWLCYQKNKRFSSLYGTNNISGLDWNIDGEINWIKADNLFVTVLAKNISPTNIPDRLCQALSNWCPHPHQLLLAKLRHEIDENGFMIANKIVNKKYLQSHWLKEILDTLNSKDENTLEFKIWNILSKHWEEIAVSTKDEMINFSSKIVSYIKNLPEDSQNSLMSKWTVKDEKKTLQHVNKFNCSIPVVGYHLNTGHIIQLDDDNEKSYWICMTPACDLQPGQKKINTGQNIPVTLVRLFNLSDAAKKDDRESGLKKEDLISRALSMATRNDLIFVSISDSDEIDIFSFIPKIYFSSNPISDNFLVGDQGRFNKSDKSLIFYKPTIDNESIPTFKSIHGKVVAQLRYEYALHLLQITGRTKSRIGLDFVSLCES
ncbi:response regulator receiver domain [Xenorhabdus doucetiae]|uniref:Response receiver domain-containing protein n=1 Tax=Xenorhabdus doucetiae TaxID=351671 RepID=A0A068QNR3_9GAMM|nr:response regulator receiver domain [Xenorhabdus doucetiae]TYP03197.1 hypothetical protein LY16_02401 [Xenorhabdus doucetiae]CDG16404.1 conserved protein of unknown function [Xenorhabdus doucetiae]